MIELVNINKNYNGKAVIDNLTYSFNETGLYWIKGKSGSGKTTLLNIISKRIKCDGVVNVSKEVFHLSFNDYLIEHFSVKENIKLHQDMFRNYKNYKYDFNVKSLLNKKVSKLSLGERQRVGLFLALSSGCEIILLDEIFSGVDKFYKKKFINELVKCAKKKLIIVTSHQDLEGYGYLLHLEDGKIKESSNKANYKDYKEKRVIKKKNKWVLLLYKKQFLSKILFIISLLSLFIFIKGINHDLEEFNSSFNNSFINRRVYSKGEVDSGSDDIYNEILLPLSNEIDEVYYKIYSDSMDKAKISVGDMVIEDSSIISNIYNYDGLNENEIILVLDKYELCANNHYELCLESVLREKIIYDEFVYNYENDYLKYLIKDVYFSDNNAIYSSFSENLIVDIEILYKNNKVIKQYYLKISYDKLQNFYSKINSIDSLLNYDFHLLNSDNSYNYFMVEKRKTKLFSTDEIKDAYVCSEVGYSCSILNFSNFNSIKYIDDLSVDKIEYKKYKGELSYNEVIISSKLSELINKKIGDSISIRFYFNDKYYILENVSIIDVYHDEKCVIYHDKYDYLLFKEKFNFNIRIEYLYSENKLNYLINDSIDYEFIKETKDVIEKITSVLEIFNICFLFIMIFVSFYIEFNRARKYDEFYIFLNRNNVDVMGFLKSYMVLYFFIGVLFISNLLFMLFYYFNFILFYFIYKRKIKSRLTLD